MIYAKEKQQKKNHNFNHANFIKNQLPRNESINIMNWNSFLWHCKVHFKLKIFPFNNL